MTTEYAIDNPGQYEHPDWGYVSKMLNTLQWELQGLHTIYAEVEALRYYEDSVQIPLEEVKSGQTVRVGLTAELIENVKAAVLNNTPRIHVKGYRQGDSAERNESKREKFWQEHLESLLFPVNIVSELCDSQLMGLGILKAGKSYLKWDKTALKRKRKESAEDHIERTKALKKKWGIPTSTVTVHPLATYFRVGEGSQVQEILEHSYKPRMSVFKQYDLDSSRITNETPTPTIQGPLPAFQPGQPQQFIRPLPMGFDTSQTLLISEYWNPDWYQIYANGTLIYEESPPTIKYIICPGRTTSSKDPDKFGLSVAENLRHNEPAINRMMTRMLEATELIVNKRLTLETPDGYIPATATAEDGTTKPETFTFNDDYAETLPPGVKIVDPFEGANQVFEALPVLNMLMQITAQHGVSPLFKGISPGAAGSGYRDNSLYLMAKSMFDYLIKSLQAALGEYIDWMEYLIVHCIREEVWIGEVSLSPKDIEDWPAKLSVELKPTLPQNLIAEGQFGENMRAAGNISRKRQREQFLGIEQPNEEDDDVMMEELQGMLKPILYQDVIATVLGRGPLAQGGAPATGLVGPNGEPISSENDPRQALGMGQNNSNGAGRGGMGQAAGRQSGGFATAGQSRQPATEPGGFPPGNNENR